MLLLLVTGLSGPSSAQEEGSAQEPAGDRRTQGPADAAASADGSPVGQAAREEAPTKKADTANPDWSQPFVGLVHTYSWHLNGLGVGQTRFTVRRVTPPKAATPPDTAGGHDPDDNDPDDNEPGGSASGGSAPGGNGDVKPTAPPELHVESHWDFAAPGRIHSAQGMTRVNAESLAPIYYQQVFHSIAQERPLPIRETTSVANGGILNTTVTNGDQSQPLNTIIPRGGVFYGNQMVEHVALFAAQTQATTAIPDAPTAEGEEKPAPPSRRLILVRPMHGDAIEGTLTHDGTEERRGVALRKWLFQAPGVKATLWLGPDGILEEYRQGGLSVRREKAKVAEKEPK